MYVCMYVCIVELAPNRVMSETVLDGGGYFILASIFGVHTLSLLLSSQAAHDRATEVTRTHNITHDKRHVDRH